MKHYKTMKMYIKTKRFFMYLLRWQLSTPILALVMWLLEPKMGYVGATIVANFIGGCMFYWVDKYIFLKHRHESE